MDPELTFTSFLTPNQNSICPGCISRNDKDKNTLEIFIDILMHMPSEMSAFLQTMNYEGQCEVCNNETNSISSQVVNAVTADNAFSNLTGKFFNVVRKMAIDAPMLSAVCATGFDTACAASTSILSPWGPCQVSTLGVLFSMTKNYLTIRGLSQFIPYIDSFLGLSEKYKTCMSYRRQLLRLVAFVSITYCVYSVVRSGVKEILGLLSSMFFGSVKLPEKNVACADGAGTIIDIVAASVCLFFGQKFTGPLFKNVLGAASVLNIKSSITNAFETGVNFVLKLVAETAAFFGCGVFSNRVLAMLNDWQEVKRAPTKIEVDVLVKKCDIFLARRPNHDLNIGSAQTKTDVENIVAELDEMLPRLTQEQTVLASTLRTKRDQMLKVLSFQNYTVELRKGRVTPPCILFAGAAGIGKTFLAREFCKLYVTYGSRQQGAFQSDRLKKALDANNICYSRVASKNFFDGYMFEPVLFLNDIFSFANCTDATSKDIHQKEISELQQAVDSSIWLPEFADLSDGNKAGKGTAVDPMMVALTSNYIWFNTSSDVNVIGRRVHYPILTVLTHDNAEKSNKFEHLRFYKKRSRFLTNGPGTASRANWSSSWTPNNQLPKTQQEFENWPWADDFEEIALGDLIPSLWDQWVEEANRQHTVAQTNNEDAFFIRSVPQAMPPIVIPHTVLPPIHQDMPQTGCVVCYANNVVLNECNACFEEVCQQCYNTHMQTHFVEAQRAHVHFDDDEEDESLMPPQRLNSEIPEIEPRSSSVSTEYLCEKMKVKGVNYTDDQHKLIQDYYDSYQEDYYVRIGTSLILLGQPHHTTQQLFAMYQYVDARSCARFVGNENAFIIECKIKKKIHKFVYSRTLRVFVNEMLQIASCAGGIPSLTDREDHSTSHELTMQVRVINTRSDATMQNLTMGKYSSFAQFKRFLCGMHPECERIVSRPTSNDALIDNLFYNKALGYYFVNMTMPQPFVVPVRCGTRKLFEFDLRKIESAKTLRRFLNLAGLEFEYDIQNLYIAIEGSFVLLEETQPMRKQIELLAIPALFVKRIPNVTGNTVIIPLMGGVHEACIPVSSSKLINEVSYVTSKIHADEIFKNLESVWTETINGKVVERSEITDRNVNMKVLFDRLSEPDTSCHCITNQAELKKCINNIQNRRLTSQVNVLFNPGFQGMNRVVHPGDTENMTRLDLNDENHDENWKCSGYSPSSIIRGERSLNRAMQSIGACDPDMTLAQMMSINFAKKIYQAHIDREDDYYCPEEIAEIEMCLRLTKGNIVTALPSAVVGLMATVYKIDLVYADTSYGFSKIYRSYLNRSNANNNILILRHGDDFIPIFSLTHILLRETPKGGYYAVATEYKGIIRCERAQNIPLISYTGDSHIEGQYVFLKRVPRIIRQICERYSLNEEAVLQMLILGFHEDFLKKYEVELTLENQEQVRTATFVSLITRCKIDDMEKYRINVVLEALMPHTYRVGKKRLMNHINTNAINGEPNCLKKMILRSKALMETIFGSPGEMAVTVVTLGAAVYLISKIISFYQRSHNEAVVDTPEPPEKTRKQKKETKVACSQVVTMPYVEVSGFEQRLAKSNFPRVSLMYKDEIVNGLNGVTFTNGLVVFPRHLIKNVKRTTDDYKLQVGNEIFKLNDPRIVTDPLGPYSDLSCVYGCISTSFDLKASYVSANLPTAGATVTQVIMNRNELTVAEGVVAASPDLITFSNGNRSLTTSAIKVVGAEVVAGNCGSLLLYKGLIVGVLSARVDSNPTTSFWTRLTEQEIRTVIQRCANLSTVQNICSESAECLVRAPGASDERRYAGRELSAFRKFETVPTPVDGEKPQPTELKLALDPENHWCPSNTTTEALEQSLSKFPRKNPMRVPVEIHVAAEYLKRRMPRGCAPSADWKSAANGYLDEDMKFRVAKPVQLDTSPGMPYTLYEKKKDGNLQQYRGLHDKKKLFDLNSSGVRTPVADLEGKCNTIWKSIYKGVLPRVPFSVSLKREIRTTQQFKEKKSRLFSAPPVHYNMCLRRLLNDWIFRFKKDGKNFYHAMGLDPHSPAWSKLRAHMKRPGYEFLSLDFSGFDTRHTLEMNQIVADIICVSYDAEWHPAIHAIVSGICQYEANLFGKEEQVLTGLASGSQITTQINTIYNVLLWLGAWVRSGERIENFDKCCTLVTYGDDCIFGTNPAKSNFTPNLMRDFCAECNHVVTAADKSPTISWIRKFQDITFLKRSFLTHGAAIYAPLPEEQIFKPLLYYKKNIKDPFERKEYAKSTLVNVILEIAEFGPFSEKETELFNTLKGKTEEHPFWKEVWDELNPQTIRCNLLSRKESQVSDYDVLGTLAEYIGWYNSSKIDGRCAWD
nr:TPA_asm: hypothetical protein [Triaenopico virus 1]